jgi:hypothetical protein
MTEEEAFELHEAGSALMNLLTSVHRNEPSEEGDARFFEYINILRKHAVTSELLPKILLSSNSVSDFTAQLSAYPSFDGRRKFIKDTFDRFFLGVNTLWQRDFASEVTRVREGSFAGREMSDTGATVSHQASVSSAAWTGNSNSGDLARAVLTLAPAAMEGVRTLLTEQEHRLHNAPPEALEADGVQALRDLYEALGLLLQSLESGADPESCLTLIKSLAAKTFSFAAGTGEILVGGLKPLLASTPVAWGSWLLLGSMCDPANFALLGPGVATAIVAGSYGLSVKGKSTQ